MAAPTGECDPSALFTLLLRLADDHLILGHRLSEWCGHGPMLEEDLALPNIALDLIGQARLAYALAGTVEDAGRDEDALAYFRTERDYVNCLLVERPNGDFGQTMLKVLYFGTFMHGFWQETLTSQDARLAAIAAKAVKESAYHVRHAAEWVIRLGDGTDESADRMAAAVAALHPYTAELFEDDAITTACSDAGVAPLPSSLQAGWQGSIDAVFSDAMLTMPTVAWPQNGGRRGMHGEALGHLLAVMQTVPRQMPEAKW